ncbi:DUF2135 domain-containing protein [Leptospira saintgironsiae]|uniref:DUF2135 domain-containing protein n=1 Tax=Leptospira saintgironsiae TaxID=2023183 RepID=A0A2M9YFK8_9LEPT|nr:DUF2135 domain-containing protein [Leptospira saintgironsiae]PJZ50337.1 DUF2135 domain-containing protein [Leptospira saintgironsiae]
MFFSHPNISFGKSSRGFGIHFLASFAVIYSFSIMYLDAETVSIDSPHGGFTTERIQKISGTVIGINPEKVTVVINGIPQMVPLYAGKFSFSTVASPGDNLVEVRAGKAYDKVSFFAKVPSRDIKVILTWDTASYTDLWVIDPSGEKCYWAHTSTKSGGNLVYDDATFAPQTFTMSKALPGNYAVQAQYYAPFNSQVTRAKVYVVLYEGTPREKRKQYQFTMTRAQQVYHLGNFEIEPD